MASDETRRFRRPIVWPVLLIVLGILLLLQNLGILPGGFWGRLFQYWPVILILVGIELLFGRRYPWATTAIIIAVIAMVMALVVAYPGPVAGSSLAGEADGTQFVSEELGNLEAATVDIGFGAGHLLLGSLPEDSTSLIEAESTQGQLVGRLEKQFSRSDGKGHFKLRGGKRGWMPFEGNVDERWTVSLTRKVPLELRLSTGASQSVVDLSDLRISQVRMDVGASSAELTLPREGATRAEIKAGAADIRVVIPDGTAARIRAKVAVGSLNVDEARFPKRGNYYESGDFSSSANRIELEIEGGVTSVTVR